MKNEKFDAAFDNFMSVIAEKTREIGERPELLNPARMRQMMNAYSFLQGIANECGASVTYDIHEPSVNIGSISVFGDNINISNPQDFLEAIECADNFDVYSRTDGTVCVDFMFYDLTISI